MLAIACERSERRAARVAGSIEMAGLSGAPQARRQRGAESRRDNRCHGSHELGHETVHCWLTKASQVWPILAQNGPMPFVEHLRPVAVTQLHTTLEGGGGLLSATGSRLTVRLPRPFASLSYPIFVHRSKSSLNSLCASLIPHPSIQCSSHAHFRPSPVPRTRCAGRSGAVRRRQTHLNQIHVGHDSLDLADDLGLGGGVNLLELEREDGLLLGRLLLGGGLGGSGSGSGSGGGGSGGDGNLGDVQAGLGSALYERFASKRERCER